MLKIWGRKNSLNVEKVLWCADELGLTYEQIDAGMQFGVVKEPFFLEMNPNGLVPTIKDDNFILWESNSIVRYLAAKYGEGVLSPKDLKERADADRWMDWQATTLWPNFRPVFWGLVRTPPEQRDQKAIDEGIKKTTEALNLLDKHLAAHLYTTGGKFTMADIPLGCAVYRWLNIPIKRPSLPNIDAWHQRLTERPAFKKNVMKPF